MEDVLDTTSNDSNTSLLPYNPLSATRCRNGSSMDSEASASIRETDLCGISPAKEGRSCAPCWTGPSRRSRRVLAPWRIIRVWRIFCKEEVSSFNERVWWRRERDKELEVRLRRRRGVTAGDVTACQVGSRYGDVFSIMYGLGSLMDAFMNVELHTNYSYQRI